MAEDQLDSLARLHEADRSRARDDQLREELGSLIERRAAKPEFLVEQRRVPHRNSSFGAWGGVVVDQLEAGQARQSLRELDRVGDRRAREQEPRGGAVDLGGAPQPPQDVAHVGAEHAAVDVRFVDDDEREVREQLIPGLVMRQDPDVEHVGIGEDHVRALANGRPLASGRVTVVDREADRLLEAEPVQRARLVLGERLGRVEVESARGRVGAQNL
jgi:hypothetical protein